MKFYLFRQPINEILWTSFSVIAVLIKVRYYKIQHSLNIIKCKGNLEPHPAFAFFIFPQIMLYYVYIIWYRINNTISSL